MPRQRMIKPKFWDDTKIAKLKRDARLLFIGMWNFSDDCGVIISDPIWIKSKIFPYDRDIQLSQFESWLTELERLGFISRLHYNNEEFLYLPKFSRHQTINKPNVDDLCIPNVELERVLEQSRINHGSITDQSCPKISIREEEDKLRKDKTKKEFSVIEIIFPFDIEFKNYWLQWKTYKDGEFKFKYKTIQSEQSAINELVSLSKGVKENAIAIINQSMAKGWKGFFELKNFNNGTNTTANKSTTDDLQAAHARRYPIGQQG